MFPLVFTVIFGFFFAKSDSFSGGKIGLINNSDSEIAINLEKTLDESDTFEVQKLSNEDEIKNLISKSSIGAGVVIPESFGDMNPESPKQIKIVFDPANAQSVLSIQGFLNSYLTQVNYQIQQATPIFSIIEEKTAGGELNYFDFVLAGLLGMALMNSSIQGIAISMAKYREDQILKRIGTTPLRAWKFVASEVLSRLVLNFIQIAVVLMVGYYGFGAHIYGNLGIIFLVALIGAALFQSIGFAIASVSKTTQAAEGMSVSVTIPMMFLSGVFFPIDQLPTWLGLFVKYLPLTPLLKLTRQVMLDGESMFTNPINITIIGCWIAFALTVSIMRFKLSEE